MIYIILSNVGFALMAIFIYFRYSHFRISSTLKIRELDKAYKKKKEEKKQIESKLRAELKNENEQVKQALRDLNQSKSDRQKEVEMRLNAEKQIAIATQKIHEAQSRVNDWKVIQDNALKSSQEVMFSFGEEIMDRLGENYRLQNDENRHFIEQNMDDLHQYMEEVAAKMQQIPRQNIVEAKPQEAKTNTQKKPPAPVNSILDEVAQKSLSDVTSLIVASGFKHAKDYLLASKLDEAKAKFMLCDLVIMRKNCAYLIDFKASRYFKEYEAIPQDQKKNSLSAFNKKIDKYLAYISNPKYRALIEKLLKAQKINYKDLKIVFALRNRDDLTLARDLKTLQKAQSLGIEILDVTGVNDLIL